MLFNLTKSITAFLRFCLLSTSLAQFELINKLRQPLLEIQFFPRFFHRER